MALFMVNFQEKAGKKFFKVWLVGTLNLCLKEPEKMQKSRNQSHKAYFEDFFLLYLENGP